MKPKRYPSPRDCYEPKQHKIACRFDLFALIAAAGVAACVAFALAVPRVSFPAAIAFIVVLTSCSRLVATWFILGRPRQMLGAMRRNRELRECDRHAV